jgi:group I intron endonuclease
MSATKDEPTFMYCIENILSGKLYIGYSTSPDTRWRDHLRTAVGGKEKYPSYSYIHKAITKHGKENFIFTVFACYHNVQEAKEAEKYWIAELKKQSVPLYNLTNGGDGAVGYIPTEITRKRMSVAHTGIMHTEVSKKKMSKTRRTKNYSGERSSFFGKHHTDEAKKKVSEANKGNTAFLGKQHTQNTIELMKSNSRGEGNNAAIINEATVMEIRNKYATGNYSYKKLAIEYGLKKHHVGDIIRGTIWTHLPIYYQKNR